HALDPFNLRTTNYLRLLDDLARFDRLETQNFIILYDKKNDPIIAEPMAEYLESIHAEICREFQHEPAEKTLIEVFPTHDGFSVRTTGSPWIGTVGASTGRVIALVSPRRGKATMGAYHWGRVLRHEYTHTITLGATENRIPHWMTEGLAVLQERQPIPWDWVPLLYHATRNDELFTLEDLTWGFIRPKRPTDRQLAYAQSFWVCQFLLETFGHDTILQQLRLYREGKPQEEVLPATTGRSITQFEREFFDWARSQIASWGYEPEAQQQYERLRQQGEDLIKSRQYREAVKVWEEIAALRPMDALPHQRLAGLYLSREIDEKPRAIPHLQRLKDVELHDHRYAKRLARLHRDLNQLPQAIEAAREATMVDPYDLDARKLLAELLEMAGDPAAAKQRELLQSLERWHADNRRENKLE
ncbi:MAG: peptidase MA family metallohydrolase, partial [Phycisphaerae bacterium]|nr:peptidase MA family metallohydrolase [Phycisphaerae bacterium]